MNSLNRPPLIGVSKATSALRDAIASAGRSDSKVLITGESGTGKEVVAIQIQAASPRAHRPFVTVNCGGLAETLLESEFFGHVRGSFTGAHRDRAGKLELADTGTIFLDEIGETSPRMQALLLRLLETGEIQKIGSDQATKKVNVRTIAATNQNLAELVQKGVFRKDLYYRLNVISIVVPPLRERTEDIPVLIEHFLERSMQSARREPWTVTPEAMGCLLGYHWPGNVRELQNVIERIVVRGREDVITVDDIPSDVRSFTPSTRSFVERRRTVADELYRRLVDGQEPFWTAVHPLFMRREISRDVVREIVRRGLVDARGNYRVVVRSFNIPPEDYKKFLNFLRKHQCQPSFRDFRPKP